MRITFVNKPVNHSLWTFIYLCCFLFGLSAQVKCEDTLTVNRPQRVEYRWKLLENYIQYQRLWEKFYGKTEVRRKAQAETLQQRLVEVPAQKPASLEAGIEVQKRGHCN